MASGRCVTEQRGGEDVPLGWVELTLTLARRVPVAIVLLT